MTNQEFIDKINERYKLAKDLIEGNGGYDISRGTAHSVSGYMEDLFALYVAQKIGSKSNKYLVDKLISIKFSKNEKATTFKPDLTIIKENTLSQYFDLKTNLGWNRDLEKYLIKKDRLIQKIKGRKGWIHFNKENIQEIQFSNSLKYKIVIFNGWNIRKNKLQKNIEIADKLENVEIFILNNWLQATKQLIIDNNAFEKLLK